VAELERGTLGTLWGARVTSSAEEGRLVVVRRLSTSVCAPRQVARMVEAAGVAKNLRHSKLAAVLDAVTTEQELAVVGEYVEGPTLSLLQRLAYAKQRPLPPAVTLRIGVDLLHGLRAARDGWQKLAPQPLRGALHGGLSPENVFIAAFGEVLLGEIGVSAVASALEPFRTLPGIAAYRAPEQLHDAPTPTTSERADVFSVGVVLWELLANRPLFGDPERLRSGSVDGADATARTLRDLQSKLIPALGGSDRGAPIPRAVADVVERALRRDPATRYATIDQMLGALLALGREVVASSDQLAVAIEGLARAEFDAQRAALGPSSHRVPSSRPSAMPDSGRPTHRPDPPAGKPKSAAGPGFDPQPPEVEQFSQHEAPTFPTAQLARGVHSQPPPPPRRKSTAPPLKSAAPPSKSAAPPPKSATPAPPSPAPPLKSATPAPPSAAPPLESAAPTPAFGEPLPPLPSLPDLGSASSLPPPLVPVDAGVAVRESAIAVAKPVPNVPGSSAVSDRQSRARTIALVIAAVVGLIGLLAVLRAALSSKPEDGAPAVAAPATAVTSVAKPAEPEPARTAPSATATVAPASPPDTETRPKPAVTEAPNRAEPARNATPNRAEPRPEPPKKAFRPKGI